MDQNRLNRLKEQYKRDRHIKPHQSTITTNNRTNALDNGNDQINSNQRRFNEDEQGFHLIFQ